jgi:hyperosmotically inducible protein
MKMTTKYRRQTLVDSILVVACLSIAFILAGCQDKGTAEKAGQKIDQATEKAGEKLEQASEHASEKMTQAEQSLNQKATQAGVYVDDSVITTQVKAALLNDALLKASKIEVNTINGVVKLSGSVESEQSLSRAVEVVNKQHSVKLVQSEMIVNVTGKK